MQYLQSKFTVPAMENRTVTQKRWDLAFSSREEFEEKYGEEPGDFVAQMILNGVRDE